MGKDTRKDVKTLQGASKSVLRGNARASEIFMSLGYDVRASSNLITWRNADEDITIVFWIRERQYITYKGIVGSPVMDMMLHKAICSQIKEMGWK